MILDWTELYTTTVVHNRLHGMLTTLKNIIESDCYLKINAERFSYK